MVEGGQFQQRSACNRGYQQLDVFALHSSMKWQSCINCFYGDNKDNGRSIYFTRSLFLEFKLIVIACEPFWRLLIVILPNRMLHSLMPVVHLKGTRSWPVVETVLNVL
jgi:hypothetical protein